jgi:aminopeptidase-like protein
MHALAARLYPLCRSLTGDGVRQTLAVLREVAPLAVHEVPTGTRVFDWTVPREWNLRQAWIRGPGGQTVVDARDHNLHVVGYSVPVRVTLPLAELLPHLHSLPEHPDWIPYRTSYYEETWGFCLAHRRLLELGPGPYEVAIDATLDPGHLTYGELLLPGERPEEYLLSTHVCHPSLANDNLSGIAVLAFLARALGARPRRRFSYRFLFVPGTIGAITWLARNEERLGRIRGVLVAAGLGDPGTLHYKRSRRGDAEIDRAALVALRDSGEPHADEPFAPFGYDERQYNSPGIGLAAGSLTRTPFGRYPEYHTSADDLAFVAPPQLAGALEAYLRVVDVLEGNARYLSLNPKCEPQLGRRGLYRALGGGDARRARELALLWVLNLADGEHDLIAVAERSGLPFAAVRAAADALLAADLLRAAGD